MAEMGDRMTNERTRYLAFSVIALLLSTGMAHAQQAFEHMTCRAGTMTVLAQGEKMIVWSLDHRGINVSRDAAKLFDGFTQRCVGVVASIEGKASGNGWCRNVDPKTGDWTLVDWMASDKPGSGTYTFRYGTGKWKGATGGGTYEALGQTRPVDAGTYQNCVIIKGSISVPG
jgi:hypothetical protein